MPHLYFFFLVFGWSFFVSATFDDVYFWKSKHSLKGQKTSIPHYLIITSYTRSISTLSPLFQKVNRLLIPPYLDGRECSASRDIYFSRKIKGVLPPNTSLEVIEVFSILQNPGFIEKLMFKILDFKKIGIRGGPTIYCLVRDPGNKEFILRQSIAYKPIVRHYNSLPAKKAANIISHFTEQETKKVLLTFELTKEHNEKCGWGWPEGQEPKIMNPKEEIKILMKKAMQFMRKNSSLYTFENIHSHSDQVEVSLDEKALAFLILNSSPLRIKNISLADGNKSLSN